MRILTLLAAALLLMTGLARAAEEGSATTYRPGTGHILESMSTSSTVTNAMGSFTSVVRVHPTEAAWIVFGTATAALDFYASVTRDMFLPADVTEYFWISGGTYIAVIQDSASGVVYINEMSR